MTSIRRLAVHDGNVVSSSPLSSSAAEEEAAVAVTVTVADVGATAIVGGVVAVIEEKVAVAVLARGATVTMDVTLEAATIGDVTVMAEPVTEKAVLAEVTAWEAAVVAWSSMVREVAVMEAEA